MSSKLAQVRRIVEDYVDTDSLARKLVEAGFSVPAKKKIILPGDGIFALMNSPDRLEKVSDGWIRDHFLSRFFGKDYFWSPPSLEKHIAWKEGEDYAAKYGMQASRFEFSTLIDPKKYNPALIEAAKVLELKTDDCYWTRDPFAGGSDGAWYVDPGFGDVFCCSKGFHFYVRPVRVSQ